MLEQKFDAIKELPQAFPALTDNLGLNLTTSSFNDSFLKARGNIAEPSMLPSAQLLLEDFGLDKDRLKTGGFNMKDVPLSAAPLSDAQLQDKLDRVSADGNKKQHKIADDAVRDPHVRKVEEIPGVFIETVVTYDDAGRRTTYEPDGKVVIEDGDTKTTRYPKDDPSGVTEVVEAPGYTQTTNKDGWQTITTHPHDITTTISPDGKSTALYPDGTVATEDRHHMLNIYVPDGTHVTLKPDGTEIVEEPGGRRTVIKHDSYAGATDKLHALYHVRPIPKP